MKASQSVTGKRSILRFLFLLGALAGLIAAIAQTENGPNQRVLIDGAQEPDRIPDWILWNEIFQMAAAHNDKSADKGQALWVEKLNLPRSAMNELIQQGYENRELHESAKNEADKIMADSKNEPNKDRVKVKLRKTEAYAQSRTLELRDKLRARIGDDAFLKLQSYARLKIAPSVKVFAD